MGRKYRLLCHPNTPAMAVTGVEVEVSAFGDGEYGFDYTVEDAAILTLPAWKGSERADELWRTTCFECFIRPSERADYLEINASPSGQWASYAFDSYREGMRASDLATVSFIGAAEPFEPDTYVCEVVVDLGDISLGRSRIGLSAVVEEEDGTRSYWALAHPADAPDFHHPDCFTAQLPPPPRA